MDNSQLQIRVDKKLKNDVSALYANIGMDLSTAIRLFFKKSLQVKGLPFSLNQENNEYDYISAMDNIFAMQEETRKANPNGMTLEQINAEIAAYRSEK